MASKRQRRRRDSKENHASFAPQKVFASPFQNLKSLLKSFPSLRSSAHTVPPTAALSKAARPTESEAEPEELFRQAMTGVRPLERPDHYRQPSKPSACRAATVDEDADVLAALCELVSGSGAFDITQTAEYVEGRRVGLDPRVVNKLRRGEFAIQAHIDLHGMTRAVAKQALSEFITRSVRNGHHSVLVVSGRGLRSPGGQPVIKHAVTYWLSHGQLSAHVLAFASARPADGGAGAMYVLLRRERRRARFEVMGITKRIP
jgi:DNA-nicking Smr family endonuclease